MKQYEFLEHTADEKFRAYGKDLEEAFSNAALATFAIMTDVSQVKAVKKHSGKVEANKKETLLYMFLEELLFLVDTEGFLLSQVENLEIKQTSDGTNVSYALFFTIVGDDADNYEVTTHIKSPTYSEMLIEEKDGQVMIQVVHDI